MKRKYNNLTYTLYICIIENMKTPEYTRKAIREYQKKQYFMQVRFPVELKERLAAAGLTSSVVADLVLKELEKREKH